MDNVRHIEFFRTAATEIEVASTRLTLESVLQRPIPVGPAGPAGASAFDSVEAPLQLHDDVLSLDTSALTFDVADLAGETVPGSLTVGDDEKQVVLGTSLFNGNPQPVISSTRPDGRIFFPGEAKFGADLDVRGHDVMALDVAADRHITAGGTIVSDGTKTGSARFLAQMRSAQTANPLEIQNSVGTPVFAVNPDGELATDLRLSVGSELIFNQANTTIYRIRSGPKLGFDSWEGFVFNTRKSPGPDYRFLNTGAEFDASLTLTQPAEGVILTSPNGTRYSIAVDDAGNLTSTPV